MSARLNANPSSDGLRSEQPSCGRCGAALRRGRLGQLCDPCAGQVDVAGVLREAGFFAREKIRHALAACDFGYVFRAVRRTASLTQQELGALLDLEQDRISRIERGERRLRDIATAARVSSRLGVPPVLLGFVASSVSVAQPGTGAERTEDWVQRRDFSWVVAGVLLGMGLDALDVERLEQLLPGDPAALATGRLGAADVQAIEDATAAFRRSDFSSGGAMCRPMAVARLRSALALHQAPCTSAVRERLLLATADLGLVAAWTSYDAQRHNDARRLWMIALSIVEETEHPRAADLSADLLLDMAHQALHLRRPREALQLVQLGYGVASSRRHPVSPSTASYLASNQAWCHAADGDAQACDRALVRSVEHFALVDPRSAPPWAAHVDAVELSAQRGHAYYTLALTTGDTTHAARAIPLLQEAVDGFGSAYARSRAVNLPGLSASHALTGNLDVATRTGREAVEEITALASPRAYDRLQSLDTVLQTYGAHPGIRDLRSQIHAALAVA